MEENDKVVIKMHKEYLPSEKKEIKLKRTISFLIIILIVAVLTILLLLFRLGTDSNFSSSSLFGNDKVDTIKSFFNDKWLYGNDYEDLNQTLDEKMYHGMTSFDEDPYTSYMDASEMSNFSSSINKIQLGIGVSYYHEFDGYLLVREVYKDSGAYNAGIKKGDYVVKIDGKDVKNCDDENVKALVLGDENTYVTITVNRDGKMMDFDCERKQFDSTASSNLIGDVVFLTISSFGDNTVVSIDNELSQYSDYHKLIIDERNNSGGYQDALLEIAGLFLEDGTEVMKEIDKKGNSKSFNASYPKKYYNFDQIIILTNEYTASAAEVFAICMKEQHPNTIIAGNTSFGKGVVQSNYVLEDGSYLKLTSSYWTSPNGVSLKDGGIEPDVELEHDDVYYLYNYDFEDNESFKYDDVSVLISNAQTILKFLNYPVGRVDGYFDNDFVSALNVFKKDQGLETNGILDSTTYHKILDAYNTSDKDIQLEKALELINK